MSLNKGNLLELDVEKLFEEQSIDHIIEVERLIDEEIERKRSELRIMVGDRYKDVLAASDAIKSMKKTSENIVFNIERISQSCEQLIAKPSKTVVKSHKEVSKFQINERTLIIQLRLTIFLNEQIWIMLHAENNLDAAQYYLLAQHIHTGLSLLKQDDLKRIPILNQIKHNLMFLRSKIFQKIIQKLESVETTAMETSKNLNALMLLENPTSIDLLNVFIEHRHTALQTVINMEYSSVRVQISSMVKCILTTITLLYECFLETKKGQRGLIWEHVRELSEETSSTATFSKLSLPVTPLLLYIPEILRAFRPRYKTVLTETSTNNVESVMKTWLDTTRKHLLANVKQLLQLIQNVQGLHLIKEESLKIEAPDNWEQICLESYFPKNFDIWYYFFQEMFTERCKSLISQKKLAISEEIKKYVNEMLDNVTNSCNPELKLRNNIWKEEPKDIIKTEIVSHKGLTMKTKGFSEAVVNLCAKLDKKFIELLEDVSQYLYGKEYNSDLNTSIVWSDFKFKRKHVDSVEIENHLRVEVTSSALELSTFVANLFLEETPGAVIKSVNSARFLQAVLQLCPHFKRCCSFNNPTEDWIKITDAFNNCIHGFWKIWLGDIKKQTEKKCIDLLDISLKKRVQMIIRWDEIEIQEQTEEKVFKSQIKIPLKPSLGLHSLIQYLNECLSDVLSFTLPKVIHLQFLEENVGIILEHYKILLNENMNQKEAIQFLFDVKFLTTFCIPRENVQLLSCSQEICDNLRNRIDPFDLDVFYSYIQSNVKKAVAQSQIIFGNLLPSSTQLANVGVSVEKNKDLDQKPSILAIGTPSTSSWFPLLPVSLPTHKTSTSKKSSKDNIPKPKISQKKLPDPARSVKQSASSFFGGLNTDWFS